MFFVLSLLASNAFADYSFDFTNGNFPEGYKKGWRALNGMKIKKNVDSLECKGKNGRFFMNLYLLPASEYDVKIEGSGNCDIVFNNHRFSKSKVSFKNIFKDSNTFSTILKISEELPEEYVFNFYGRDKDKPFYLKKMTIIEKPDSSDYIKLNRVKLQKSIPNPDTARAVVLDDLSVEKITELKRIGTKFVWIKCDGDISKSLKILETLKASDMKAIVDLSQLKESKRLSAYSQLKDFSNSIWAWCLFASDDNSADCSKILSDFRRLSKDWVVRKIKVSGFSKDKRLDDYNVIYSAEIANKDELKKAAIFVNITPAPFMAIGGTDMLQGFESYNMNWALADYSDYLNARRFLQKNASKDFQLADLSRAVREEPKDTLKFVFISDMHYHSVPKNPNAISATSLSHSQDMAKVARELQLDFIACGGDIVTGRKDRAENIADIATMFKAAEESGLPVIYSIGNHDDAGTYWLRKDPKLHHLTTGKDWHDTCVAPTLKKGGVGDELFPEANYYYFDFPKHKVRLINIAALENPMTTDAKGNINYDSNANLNMSGRQLNWFARKALDFSDKPDAKEWGVILLSHSEIGRMPNGRLAIGILKAFKEGGKYSGETLKGHYPAKVSCDFSMQGEMKIIAALEGHVHFDDVVKSKLGYPRIQCLNDKNVPEWINSPRRHLGEADDASWSILSLDRKNGKIKLFRFGAGCDTTIDID